VRLAVSLTASLLLSIAVAAALAAPEVTRSAPRDEASLVLSGKRLTIAYGRPSLRGRDMFGVLVPFGKIWRTGADEATKLSTEIDLRFGALLVPKGDYSLFTIPGERAWQLVVNQTADQWGAFNYESSRDLGRVPLRLQGLSAPIERLSIALTASGETAGTLWIGWEKTVASVDFEAVPEPPAAATALPPSQ
jgi:hypothetical protein